MQLAGMKTWIAGFFLAAALSVPAVADTNPALPGTLNYVEGNTSIDHQGLSSASVGSTTLQAGQTITTDNGRAEVLLTPGVYLRLGNDSSAEMISPDITNTVVALNQGQAIVEVDEIHDQNNLQIKDGNATTVLQKKGIYEFSTNPAAVRVFKGQVKVETQDRNIKVKSGHELSLANTTGRLKTKKFDKDQYESFELYRWSSLRSEYLAEANVNAAQIYVANGWNGAGWYWDPYFSSYTFLPGAGVLYSPFGWRFYSPAYLYGYGYPEYGYYGYPWGYRTGPRVSNHGVAHAYAPHSAPRVMPQARGPRVMVPHVAARPGASFHSFGSAGFHGAVGGFHGGGGVRVPR